MPNPYATGKELVILGMLRDQQAGMYGLELVKLSDGKLKRGSIYVELDRLEDKGFVKWKLKADYTHPGLPRPIYSITAHGERALAAAEMMGIQFARM